MWRFVWLRMRTRDKTLGKIVIKLPPTTVNEDKNEIFG